MRRVFKTRSFARWSRKVPIADDVLCAAVEEMASGLVDADLGGHVYQKRVPVPGRGKRGGARTIIGSNLGDRWFFLFGFEKNERAAIDARELGHCRRSLARCSSWMRSCWIRRALRVRSWRFVMKKRRLLDEMHETARGLVEQCPSCVHERARPPGRGGQVTNYGSRLTTRIVSVCAL